MLERRAVARTKTIARVSCTSAAKTRRAQVCDISTAGCMIQSCRAAVGEMVQVRFSDGGFAQGKVIWRRDRDAGVQFSSPLQAAVTALSAYEKMSAELDAMLRTAA